MLDKFVLLELIELLLSHLVIFRAIRIASFVDIIGLRSSSGGMDCILSSSEVILELFEDG